jgi:hypothetical protein
MTVLKRLILELLMRLLKKAWRQLAIALSVSVIAGWAWLRNRRKKQQR